MSGSWNWAPGPKAQAWNWMPKCSAQPANARNLRRHAVADENIASKDGRFRIVSLTPDVCRSEEHTSELQSPDHLVCRLLLEKKKKRALNKKKLSAGIQKLKSKNNV